ncbi:MAG: acyltransferase [Acidobacteria bacterium]|nr:acyltransferase [Acidobacteriota bacterium]
MKLKILLKRCVQGICLLLALPPALLAGFGRIESAFVLFAHCFALAPGIVGDYLRAAYYRLTLREASMDVRVSFGSFFAHPQVVLARNVYIGSYCVIGRARIGERTQIASHVQILSGRYQHTRDKEGRIFGSEHGTFTETTIGADCWIGAAAIVMADLGAGSTIGAGAVVTKPIPSGVIAVGNPAAVIRQQHG